MRNHWEVCTTTHQDHEVAGPKSVKPAVHSTETNLKATPGPTLETGAPVKITTTSISGHDLPNKPMLTSNVPTHEQATLQQSAPLVITGESEGIENMESTLSGDACYLGNLGNSYAVRFVCMANHQDWLNNTGNLHFYHFEHTGNIQDIDYAISYYQRAVDSSPSGNANLPGYFNNLGNSYFHHFEHTGNVQDIKHAICHYKRAVDSTPSDNAYLPAYFNSLGIHTSSTFNIVKFSKILIMLYVTNREL